MKKINTTSLLLITCACLAGISKLHGMNNQELNNQLLHAAERGEDKRVQQLLTAGANVDTTGQLRRTPLHIAAQKGHVNIIRKLIDAGADIEAKSQLQSTPSHCTLCANTVRSSK